MTNKGWHRCKQPIRIIESLKGVVSERKGQLYLCGGCRAIWHLLYSEYSRQAIDVAERFADGLAAPEDLHRANYSAESPTFGYDFKPGIWRSWSPDGTVPSDVQRLVEMGVLRPEQLEEDEPEVNKAVRSRLLAAASLAEAAASRSPFECDWWHRYITKAPWPGDWLLRCVFGNPFLPFVFLSPAWLTPNVVDLARTIYEERAFDRMPNLGDALKAAGCLNQDMLDHCRGRDAHVRGCWVVDLVLGKS